MEWNKKKVNSFLLDRTQDVKSGLQPPVATRGGAKG